MVVTAASLNSLNLPLNGTGISASFDGDSIDILPTFNTNYANTNYWAGIYVLETPSAGTGTLSFDFNANISGTPGAGDPPNPSGTTTWQIGVFSLSNVDLTNPILVEDYMSSGGETYTDPLLSAGDFFLMGQSAFGDFGTPNYTTEDGSQVVFFNNQSANGSRSYQSEYAILTEDDLVGTSITFDSNGTTRGSGSRPTIIFNSVLIPEPTSGALLMGAFGLLALRRRRG